MGAMHRRSKAAARARDRQSRQAELVERLRRGTYLVDPARIARALLAHLEARHRAAPERTDSEPEPGPDDERR